MQNTLKREFTELPLQIFPIKTEKCWASLGGELMFGLKCHHRRRSSLCKPKCPTWAAQVSYVIEMSHLKGIAPTISMNEVVDSGHQIGLMSIMVSTCMFPLLFAKCISWVGCCFKKWLVLKRPVFVVQNNSCTTAILPFVEEILGLTCSLFQCSAMCDCGGAVAVCVPFTCEWRLRSQERLFVDLHGCWNMSKRAQRCLFSDFSRLN